MFDINPLSAYETLGKPKKSWFVVICKAITLCILIGIIIAATCLSVVLS